MGLVQACSTLFVRCVIDIPMRIPLVLSGVSAYFILGISISNPIWIQGRIKFLSVELDGNFGEVAAGSVGRTAPSYTYYNSP